MTYCLVLLLLLLYILCGPHMHMWARKGHRKTREPTVGEEQVKSVHSAEEHSGGTDSFFCVCSCLSAPSPHKRHHRCFTLPTNAIGPRFVFRLFLCLPPSST